MISDRDLDRMADAALDGDFDDDPSLALVAASAAIALGASGASSPLPDALRQRIHADADRFFARTDAHATRRSWPWKAAACAGWLAAAASWVVAAALLWPRPPKAGDRPEPAGWTASLKAGDHPLALGATGRVTWDQAAQSGLLKIRGLARVDPGKGVYQLWIFDADRDPRYPVDGGTFAVADASATTAVPVRARLDVGRPKLFAVTLEPPGGVVVSDRQRIMLTASYP